MVEEMGVPIRDFVKGRTQPELGRLLGITQSAVSQMLHSGRDVRIMMDAQGRCSAIEIRQIGRRDKKTAA